MIKILRRMHEKKTNAVDIYQMHTLQQRVAALKRAVKDYPRHEETVQEARELVQLKIA